jgi:trk system potassium uptake protein TrkA
MRAIIVGAGDIGMPIIHYLAERGHVLSVFEKAEERCKHIANHADAAIFCCSGNIQDVWRNAEAEKADLLMALTNDDEVNADVSRIAKKDYGIPFVIARAHQPGNIDKIKEAGADIVICPSQETIRVFLNALESRSIETLYENERLKFKIAIVTVPSNGAAIGKSLNQTGVSGNCEVPNVIRNGSFLVPDESFVFKSGDKVVVTGSLDDVEKIAEKLRFDEIT